MRPVSHSEYLPIPTAPGKYIVDSVEGTSDDPNHHYPEIQSSISMRCSHHEITHAGLNYLLRGLKLSQTSRGLLWVLGFKVGIY